MRATLDRFQERRLVVHGHERLQEGLAREAASTICGDAILRRLEANPPSDDPLTVERALPKQDVEQAVRAALGTVTVDEREAVVDAIVAGGASDETYAAIDELTANRGRELAAQLHERELLHLDGVGSGYPGYLKATEFELGRHKALDASERAIAAIRDKWADFDGSTEDLEEIAVTPRGEAFDAQTRAAAALEAYRRLSRAHSPEDSEDDSDDMGVGEAALAAAMQFSRHPEVEPHTRAAILAEQLLNPLGEPIAERWLDIVSLKPEPALRYRALMRAGLAGETPVLPALRTVVKESRNLDDVAEARAELIERGDAETTAHVDWLRALPKSDKRIALEARALANDPRHIDHQSYNSGRIVAWMLLAPENTVDENVEAARISMLMPIEGEAMISLSALRHIADNVSDLPPNVRAIALLRLAKDGVNPAVRCENAIALATDPRTVHQALLTRAMYCPETAAADLRRAGKLIDRIVVEDALTGDIADAESLSLPELHARLTQSQAGEFADFGLHPADSPESLDRLIRHPIDADCAAFAAALMLRYSSDFERLLPLAARSELPHLVTRFVLAVRDHGEGSSQAGALFEQIRGAAGRGRESLARVLLDLAIPTHRQMETLFARLSKSPRTAQPSDEATRFNERQRLFMRRRSINGYATFLYWRAFFEGGSSLEELRRLERMHPTPMELTLHGALSALTSARHGVGSRRATIEFLQACANDDSVTIVREAARLALIRYGERGRIAAGAVAPADNRLYPWLRAQLAIEQARMEHDAAGVTDALNISDDPATKAWEAIASAELADEPSRTSLMRALSDAKEPRAKTLILMLLARCDRENASSHLRRAAKYAPDDELRAVVRLAADSPEPMRVEEHPALSAQDMHPDVHALIDWRYRMATGYPSPDEAEHILELHGRGSLARFAVSDADEAYARFITKADIANVSPTCRSATAEAQDVLLLCPRGNSTAQAELHMARMGLPDGPYGSALGRLNRAWEDAKHPDTRVAILTEMRHLRARSLAPPTWHKEVVRKAERARTDELLAALDEGPSEPKRPRLS